MLSRLGRNLRSFVWALVLGLAVWVAAVTAADPDELRVYPNPVSIEIHGLDPRLVVTSDMPRDVRLTMRAPQSVWNQIVSRPDSLRAVVDLAGLAAGPHRLTVEVSVDARPVRVVTVSPALILVEVESVVSRTMPVESTISGQPAIGYQAGDLSVVPMQVELSGPKSLIGRAAHVRVVVNVGNAREGLDQDNPLEVLDKTSRPIAGLSVQPPAAHITLPVIRQGGFRDMAVKVVVRGQVAAGYRLTGISVFPPVVTVYSDNPDLVSALPGVVQTQPLDLNAASSDLNLQVSLDLPVGISVVGRQNVLIQAGISPIQSSLTLKTQKVELTGLPRGLDAQVSPSAVDVILSGPIPILDTLSRQDVHVAIDVTGLGPGSYQLTPAVQILASNLTVESLLPNTIEVILALKGSPSPRP